MNSARAFMRLSMENPAATMIFGTGVLSAGLIFRAQYRSQQLAVEFQNSVTAALKDSVEANQALVRNMETKRVEDVKSKDALAQRLHRQNVEQTRAIDRLLAALKVCQIDVTPRVAAQTALPPSES